MPTSYLALDIGGTKIYGARYDSDLKLEAEDRTPTQGDKGREIVYKNIVQ